MQTYPLKSITLEEAKEMQFRLVDEICKEFTGAEFLNLGDLGVIAEINKPIYTQKVERVLASFFHAEKAILVTGAGTGALRWGLQVLVKANGTVLVHKAPIYPTTKTSLEALNVKIIEADFNKPEEVLKQLKSVKLDAVLIQHTRQKIDDSYDLGELIKLIKSNQNIPIITDDNYAAMKSAKIGVELGADLSTFSAFKLLGPEGVGILLGSSKVILSVDKMNYSGGGKVQGFQAMEVLRGLVYAPVALAIQAEESEKLVVTLKNSKIKEISSVYLANAQSKVLLVEFNENIAEQVLIEAQKLGAAPNPVGAESKYEIIPLFYRVSATFLSEDPVLSKRMIRINPMRSGASTVLRILEESIKRVKACS
jgi:mRNA-degrading endonuclease HigB of HigAB toxin-antitoxin module